MSTPHIFGVFLYLMFFEDILGIISFVVDEEGEISSARDYYACGEELRGLASPDPDGNKYQFTEKERDSETELDYFGARYYDSELGRWTSVDPLADKYPGWSPYNYALNNPILNIDSDGRAVDPFTVSTGIAVGIGVGVGLSVAATIEATSTSLNNNGRMPSQIEVELTAVKMAFDVANEVSSWFSSSEGETNSENNQSISGEPADPNNQDNDRHGKFKEQVQNYKDKGLRKSQRNLKRRISEHQGKIKNNPESTAKNHWEGEMKTWREQLEIVKEEMLNRGL